jgi:mannosyl-glycoprotein endo-beta-N-acetylglucosaminidase
MRAKVLGTFIMEWDKGSEICIEMLATRATAQMYAERLSELAAELGYDGWLVICHMRPCDSLFKYL